MQEYNIQKTDEIEPFFSNDGDLKEKNMNFLNPFWSELVTMWYVWKNEKKSKLVGFQHYRRRFASIPHEIKDGDAYMMKFCRFQLYRCDNGQQYVDIIEEGNIYDCNQAKNETSLTVKGQFIWRHGDKYIEMAEHVLEEDPANKKYIDCLNRGVMVPWCCFILKWRDFINLAEWLFGVIDKMMKKMGLEYTYESYHDYFVKDYGEDKDAWRMFSYLGERLISAYLLANFNCIALNKDDKNRYIFSNHYYND